MVIVAAGWAALAAATLLLGALIVHWLHPSSRAIAVVMALGSGVLVASVAYDLVDDALADVALPLAMVAVVVGAVAFVLGARRIERSGGQHRKHPQHTHAADASTALAIALGSVLDGVPESFTLGLTVLQGAVSVPLLAGIALSNLPEGMASTSGLLKSGWPLRRVLGMWTVVMLASATAGALGVVLLSAADPQVAALVQMFAGGALLAMVVDTMVPEAYAVERTWTGLLAVLGFAATIALGTL